jgi:hypothetical protein
LRQKWQDSLKIQIMPSRSILLRTGFMKVGKEPFDPSLFLAKVGAGKTRAELRKRQIVFSQGDPADAVFYIEGAGSS